MQVAIQMATHTKDGLKSLLKWVMTLFIEVPNGGTMTKTACLLTALRK